MLLPDRSAPPPFDVAKSPRTQNDVWNGWLVEGASWAGKLEMPRLSTCSTVPGGLTRFSDAHPDRGDGTFVHFFQNDHEFDAPTGGIWRRPWRYLERLRAYGGVIAPDFSVYREMPLVLQAYQVYRSRAFAYWLTQNGILVMPSVRWGDERSFDFCFDGLPKHSVVAVGTLGGAINSTDRQAFEVGFIELVSRLKPSAVLVYGSNRDDMIPPLWAAQTEISHHRDYTTLIHRGGVV